MQRRGREEAEAGRGGGVDGAASGGVGLLWTPIQTGREEGASWGEWGVGAGSAGGAASASGPIPIGSGGEGESEWGASGWLSVRVWGREWIRRG